MNQTNRQKKIGGLLQQELAQLFRKMLNDRGVRGTIITVTGVNVTVDLAVAKVTVSVFPAEQAAPILEELNELKHTIRFDLARTLRHQLRRMPELIFYNDESLEYIEKIEKALRRENDPLKDPDSDSKK